jgi:hypothetical protein
MNTLIAMKVLLDERLMLVEHLTLDERLVLVERLALDEPLVAHRDYRVASDMAGLLPNKVR